MAFLMNTWYMAAYAQDVPEGGVLARRLVDLPIVFFRDADGVMVGLLDQCPHRFAPLSAGKLLDDGSLQCGYHGLQFDSHGSCVLNPHGDRTPQQMAVRAFPVVERHGHVWFWPGDPDRADPVSVPDFSFRDREDLCSRVRETIHFKANYQLIVENLLDLTHTNYVHPSTLKADDKVVVEHVVEMRGDELWSCYDMPHTKPAPFWDALVNANGQPVDSWIKSRLIGPGSMSQYTGVTMPGQPRSAGKFFIANILTTPETDVSSWHFVGMARNFGIDDPGSDDHERQLLESAVAGEDRRMIEKQQERIGSCTDIDQLRPVYIAKIDAAAIKYRRGLRDAIQAEQEGSRPKAGATA